MKYLPFLTGVYSTAPGLVSIAKAGAGKDRLIFQIDDMYRDYLLNKEDRRTEDIHKYYCEHQLQGDTIEEVNKYVVQQLIQEYPEQFTLSEGCGVFLFVNHLTGEHVQFGPDWKSCKNEKYVSLFDALCCQVQEDIAIVQVHDEDDWLAAIHLCAPNHWAPHQKIGKPFNAIHLPVPAMERTLQNYQKMLLSIVQSKMPHTRFAWGIATDTRLNHHPEPPPGIDPQAWQGRAHKDATWYIRTERQNFIGFPGVKAFMFTIRTYFYKVSELNGGERAKLAEALKSMTPETLRYKGLNNSIDSLLASLGTI